MKSRFSGIGRWSASQWTAAIGASLLVTLAPLSYLQWLQRDLDQPMAALAAVLAGVVLILTALLVHARHRIAQIEAQKPTSPEPTAAQDAANTDQCKSAFLIRMTQEIRTPFQGVLGMLNMLDETHLDGQQRDYVQTARDSAQHLLGMLNDIQDVSNIASGRLRLSLESMCLRTLVQEVESTLRASAIEKGLALEVGIAPDLPEWVMADAARVRQILVSLLSNAVKYTHEGSISLRLSRLEDTPGGVCLTVQDTGMGMDAATVAQLFTRICQTDALDYWPVGSSRMGLEIARNLATMMGGSMQVSSEPGQGSLFTVHMVLPETDAPARGSHHTPSTNPTRRLRVLVAEDHPINLKYMHMLLERMGHEAVFCENGEETLQLLERQHFDIVLLDYRMPVLDGLETTAAIRGIQGANSSVSVVLITADVMNDTRKKALAMGVNEFVSKPVQAHDLQRAFQRCGLVDPDGTGHGSLTEGAAVPVTMSQLKTMAGGLIDTQAYTDVAAIMPPSVMDELLSLLFEEPDGSVHVLLASLECNEAEQIAHDAHKLKGAAMLLGLRSLVDTASEVERLADLVTLQQRHHLISQLRTNMNLTKSALRELTAGVPV